MKPDVENIFDPRLDDLMAFFHRVRGHRLIFPVADIR
jgi:hypothetical protein